MNSVIERMKPTLTNDQIDELMKCVNDCYTNKGSGYKLLKTNRKILHTRRAKKSKMSNKKNFTYKKVLR